MHKGAVYFLHNFNRNWGKSVLSCTPGCKSHFSVVNNCIKQFRTSQQKNPICPSKGNQLSQSARKKEKLKSKERRLDFLQRLSLPSEDLHLNGCKNLDSSPAVSMRKQNKAKKLRLNVVLYIERGIFCPHSALMRHKAVLTQMPDNRN